MSVKINREKENAYRNFLASNKGKIVREIIKNMGFEIDKEIYRNFDIVCGKYHMRSLIYKGSYENKDAVLKIHGTEAVSHDLREIKDFERQNTSELIRAPILYAHKNWSKNRGYGFTIFEYIGTPEICSRPFPSPAQLQDFGRFYQEYRTKAITKPWIEPPTESIIPRMFKSVNEWLKNAEVKKRLRFDDYAERLIRFYSISLKCVENIPVEFMHMHLYPEHIHKWLKDRYVILDHMSWGYRLQWADLSYMIWRTMLDIRDNSYSFENLIDYVNMWLSAYKKIPLVKKDGDFETKINFLLLERSIGIILGDLGGGKYWGTSEGKKYFKHMLHLQQRLFDYLADRLEDTL